MLIAPSSGAAGRQLRRLRDDFGIESEALVRRVVWRVAQRITPVMAVDKDGLRLFVSTADQTLGRRLFCYQRVPQRDIERAFSVLSVIPGVAATLAGGSVLEVGANIGSHTVEFLTRYGARSVIAIEPDPGNFALLRQNVLVNELGGRATLHQLAASDVDGVVELELSEDNPGDHRVRVAGGPRSGPDDRRATISVPAARLDSLELDVSALALVWVDVQGHEAHVLRGAEKLLGSAAPIVIEYWPEGLRRAGGLEHLQQLIAERYPYVIDLRSRDGGQPQVLPARRLAELESELGWTGAGHGIDPATDLILARDLDPDLQLPTA